VIKKPRGRGGHSPHWAAEPERIKLYYYSAPLHSYITYSYMLQSGVPSSELCMGKKIKLLFVNYWKGKAIPLQALTGPEGSRRLRLPDFKTVGT
jgi:hypothetical protein